MIHVARDGAKLGEFSLEQIREGLRTGQFRPTDLGWESGMPDWRSLAAFMVEKEAAATPPGEAVPGAPLVTGGSAVGTQPEAGLPWEHRQQLGFFKAYFDTVTVLLMKPSEAFTLMKREGGLTDPLLFVLIGGSASILVSVLFQIGLQSLVGLGGSNNVMNVFGGGVVVLILFLVLAPVLLALGMFVGSGILHLFLMMVGGAHRPFETTFRVFCYSWGAAYLFSIIPFCGGYVTPIYSVVLQSIGVSRAHETTMGKAVLAVLLPLVICCGVGVLIFVLIMASYGGDLRSLFH
jgi:hypothetical protein